MGEERCLNQKVEGNVFALKCLNTKISTLKNNQTVKAIYWKYLDFKK